MRRIVSIVGAAVLLVVLAGCDWAQYGANGANTGSALASSVTAQTVGSLQPSWTVSSPNLSPAALAVVNDAVYASSSVNPFQYGQPPAPPPPLEARAVSDGSLRWSAGGETIVNNSAETCGLTAVGGAPVIAGGKYNYLSEFGVCVLAGHSAPACADAPIDTATGTPGTMTYDPNGCIASNPVAADDGTVYVARTPEAFANPGPNGTGPAIIGSDGSVFVPPATTPAVASLSTPAVDGNTLYTITDTGQLLAFDRTSHALLWSTNAGTNAASTPSVAAGRVFVTIGSATEAFDAATGAPLWSTPLPDAGTQEAPAATPSQVFVRTGDTLVALDAATGAVQWEGALGASSGTVSSLGSPSIANDVVFVGTQDGRLLAFAAAPTGCSAAASTCAPIWSATLSGPTDASRPAITSDSVYISAENGSAGSQLYKFGL